jgi:hypothetical protein
MKKHLYINVCKSPEEAVLLLKKTVFITACCFFILLKTSQAQQITVWPGDANNDGIVNLITCRGGIRFSGQLARQYFVRMASVYG